MKTIDMRGQPCPIPLVNAKNELAKKDVKGVVVLVDNKTAVQNLEKFANRTHCLFSFLDEKGAFRVCIIKGADTDNFFVTSSQTAPSESAPIAKKEPNSPLVLISSDCMGKGEEELGRLLIKGFIFSLAQLNPLPEAIIFLNSGVRLVMEGSNTVPDLKELEEKGCSVYVCGTCVNYYKLTESLAVGSITDMMFITKRLASASAIITI